MIELFDSHCHVDEVQFDEDRDAVHARMLESGVTRYTVLGSDMATSRHAIDYTAVRPGAYAAIGIHPESAGRMQENDLALLREWSKAPNVVAIGEIGLDYHYDDAAPRDVQAAVCEAQMELAWELGLPVAYHIRDAHQDMIEILKKHKAHLTGGIIHCFSGSWENAKEYLKLGYYISFPGTVTFKKAPRIQEVAVKAPRDRILIETDCPYMAPEPVRGRRNEPSYVRYVAEKIAALRGETLEEVAAYTTQNALNAYRIK